VNYTDDNIVRAIVCTAAVLGIVIAIGISKMRGSGDMTAGVDALPASAAPAAAPATTPRAKPNAKARR
jgi:hypothetical protein